MGNPNDNDLTRNLATIFEFIELFECDYKCLKLLEELRWPDGYVCPRCGASRGYRIPEYKLIQCAECRYQSSATSGTIFHKSHVPIRKWFTTIMLLVTDKSGLSALRLHRIIEVSYKTALNMLKKLRSVMGLQNRLLREGAVELYLLENILKNKMENPIQGVFNLLKTEQLAREAEQDSEHERSHNSPLPQMGTCSLTTASAKEKQEASPKEIILSRKQSTTVSGAVALSKHFFLGTFHRASTKYLQLYFDEFVYRYKRDNSIQTLLKFLTECSRTSVANVFRYIKSLQVNAEYSFEDENHGFLHEEPEHYKIANPFKVDSEMTLCA